jgi:hypothetical protein
MPEADEKPAAKFGGRQAHLEIRGDALGLDHLLVRDAFGVAANIEHLGD